MICPRCQGTIAHPHKRALLKHASECKGLAPGQRRAVKQSLSTIERDGHLPYEPPARGEVALIRNQPRQFVDGVFARGSIALTRNMRID